MRPLRAVVVDDEPRARRRLLRLLEEHPDLRVVAEAAHGEAAVAAVLQHRPEVLFLDVQMPGMDGLTALDRLRATLPEALQPCTVFTTAYEQHAVEAFALEGLDYLLKPIDRQHLARALKRVRRRQTSDRATAARNSQEPEERHLAVHRAGRIHPLPLAEVALVEVEDTITFVIAESGRFRLPGALHAAEENLPTPPFIRINRSQIVNLDHVRSLAPGESGTWTATLEPPHERSLRIARRRVKRVREMMAG